MNHGGISGKESWDSPVQNGDFDGISAAKTGSSMVISWDLGYPKYWGLMGSQKILGFHWISPANMVGFQGSNNPRNWHLSRRKNDFMESNRPYLVGGLVAIFYFPIQLGIIIIPMDELIFFRGVAQPPTRYLWSGMGNLTNKVVRNSLSNRFSWGYERLIEWEYVMVRQFTRPVNRGGEMKIQSIKNQGLTYGGYPQSSSILRGFP